MFSRLVSGARPAFWSALGVALLLLGSVEADAASGYWSGSRAECNALQTSSMSTYADCMAQHLTQQYYTNNSLPCSDYAWDVNNWPAGGPPTYTAGGDVFRQAYTGVPSPSCQPPTTDMGSGNNWSGSITIVGTECDEGGTWNPSTGECEYPSFDCGTVVGVQKVRYYEEPAYSGGLCVPPPGGEEDECAATAASANVCADGLCFGTLEFTGLACDAEPPPDEGDTVIADPPQTNCVSGGGMSLCFAKEAENCGQFNGERICVASMEGTSCAGLSSGGVICGPNATNKPTESDGTTPATADGEFEIAKPGEAAQTFEFYSSSTVSSSGSGVPTTPADGGNDIARSATDPRRTTVEQVTNRGRGPIAVDPIAPPPPEAAPIYQDWGRLRANVVPHSPALSEYLRSGTRPELRP